MDEKAKGKMIANLEDYARGIVESKAREEAGRVLLRMKDRFTTLFSQDADSMPRVWTGKEDIRGITKTARSALLAVMAAIRLDDESDNIEKILSTALADTPGGATTNKSIAAVDPLAMSTWPEVPPSKIMLSHVQCESFASTAASKFELKPKSTVTVKQEKAQLQVRQFRGFGQHILPGGRGCICTSFGYAYMIVKISAGRQVAYFLVKCT